MKLVVVQQRLTEEDDGPLAVETICLPQLGIFGAMTGMAGTEGPRAALDAARAVLSVLPEALSELTSSERLTHAVTALYQAMSARSDLGLELALAVVDNEHAVIATVGTCSALHVRRERVDRVTKVDALTGGPQDGSYVVTRLLTSSSPDVHVVELPLAPGESVALVSPRVTRALEMASPTLSFLASSLAGYGLFLSELACDLEQSDVCVVLVQPESRAVED